MNRTSSLKAAFLLAITMTFGSAMAASNAGAAVEMQRVEVAGQKAKDIARLDVKAACPAITQELRSALRSSYDRHEANGVVRVQFRVLGDQVSAVTSRNPALAAATHSSREPTAFHVARRQSPS